MRHLALTTIFGTALCFLLPCCRESTAGGNAKPPAESTLQLVAVEGLGTVELIELLAHSNELTRTRAHLELLRYLVVEIDAPEYPDRLTLFHKFAPHACRARHESQTLHILGLFVAQEDISSILIKQCLRSPHARVRATTLELARFYQVGPDWPDPLSASIQGRGSGCI
jgi:hypothetical protein